MLVGQLAHVASEVAPVEDEYSPTPHSTQTELPEEPAYDPALHEVQVDIEVADTVTEYVPAGHGTHEAAVDAPSEDEYVPALHERQSSSP